MLNLLPGINHLLALGAVSILQAASLKDWQHCKMKTAPRLTDRAVSESLIFMGPTAATQLIQRQATPTLLSYNARLPSSAPQIGATCAELAAGHKPPSRPRGSFHFPSCHPKGMAILENENHPSLDRKSGVREPYLYGTHGCYAAPIKIRHSGLSVA